jgi:DNA helicase IV
MNHLAADHSVTFVMDAAQRIYPRGYSWREVGVSVSSTYRLGQNFRNTVQVAAFAQPLLEGLELTDDGTLPDFTSCVREGPIPIVLEGRFSAQVDHVIQYIQNEVVLEKESVALLQLRGGLWFEYLKQRLTDAGVPFAEITRQDEWPTGPENVALSTLHSAKGLEFDHVCVLGLNAELTPHGEEPDDAQLDNLRRLLAMAVGRARQSVIVGYKPEDASTVIDFLDPESFVKIKP